MAISREVMRTTPDVAGISRLPEAYRAKVKHALEFRRQRVQSHGADVQNATPLVRIDAAARGCRSTSASRQTGCKDTADAWVNARRAREPDEHRARLASGQLSGVSIDRWRPRPQARIFVGRISRRPHPFVQPCSATTSRASTRETIAKADEPCRADGGAHRPAPPSFNGGSHAGSWQLVAGGFRRGHC